MSCVSIRLLGLLIALSLATAGDQIPLVPGTAFAQGAKAKKKPAGSKRGAKRPKRKKSAPRGKGPRIPFEKAQKLYRAGKYQQALAAYHEILTRYPGHEPSTIQYAKTLYRMDRIRESYTMFARVNPQHLDAETSYEYGWAFYTHQQWQGALYAFKRVPQGHALFDLANYYGAKCAIKLHKYEEAEDMLEKAVVLPDKLAKRRTLYLKHVQALRLMRQKAELSKARKDAKRTLDKTDKGAAAQAEPAKAPAEAPADEKYSHKGKKGVSQYASVKYAVERQLIDYHGYSAKTYDAKVATFEFGTGPIFPLPIKEKDGRQAAFGCQLDLIYESRITKGKQERVIIEEDQQELARVLVEDLETTDAKSGQVIVNPWFEFPAPQNMWFNFGGEIYRKYPEFEEGNRSGSNMGYLGMAIDHDKMAYSAKVYYSEALDSEGKQVVIVTAATGTATYTLPNSSTLSATPTHKRYDYIAESTNGPDAVTILSAKFSQPFPFGISATASGAYEHHSNYVVNDLEGVGGATAGGQIISGKLALSIAPAGWISFAISENIISKKWDVEDKATQDAFEQATSNYVEEFAASASLNLLF